MEKIDEKKTIQFSPEPIKWYLTKLNNHTVLPYTSGCQTHE